MQFIYLKTINLIDGNEYTKTFESRIVINNTSREIN